MINNYRLYMAAMYRDQAFAACLKKQFGNSAVTARYSNGSQYNDLTRSACNAKLKADKALHDANRATV